VALASSRAIALAAAQFADRTRHYIALRLLPFLFVLYIINYLDRTSVAYAAIGMSRELGFSDRVVGMGVGVFFISYVALQIPGAVLVERWSAHKMISATMIAWGSMTALTALVHTPTQLYLARFVLGAAEAGFFPGVIVYLSHWFIRGDRAKATSNFMAAIPLSLVIGSPIAGWILGHKWFAIEGWRWLFVLEGMPALLLGIVAFFLLTDWPSDAAWLAPEQQQWITQKLEEEKPSNRHSVSVVQTLRSRTVLLLAGAAFFDYFAAYAIIFWLPTILKRQSGFSDMRVGMLGAIPYAVAFLAMLFNGWHSDRSCERRWHTAVPLFVTAAGLLGLIHLPGSTPVTVALFTMVCVFMAFLSSFWAIPTEILSESTAAFAVGMINALASVAGFAGPYAFGYLNTRTGSFSTGFTVLMVSALASGILILLTPARQRASAETLAS
jgi:ACS family tartrate transporter-like MFS transporter